MHRRPLRLFHEEMNAVKRWTAVVLTACFLTLGMFGCTIGYDGIPYGMWHCDDPDLTLYIDPNDTEMRYTGVYVEDGREIPVLLFFDVNADVMTISQVEEGKETVYFRGSYKIRRNGKLYLTISGIFEVTPNSHVFKFESIGEYDVSSSVG